jgi:hypothetical protein
MEGLNAIDNRVLRHALTRCFVAVATLHVLQGARQMLDVLAAQFAGAKVNIDGQSWN